MKLLEQYDPSDLSNQAISQPYAYVADHMLEIKLGVSISEEMSLYDAKARAESVDLGAENAPFSVPTSPTSAHGSGSSSGNGTVLSARELRRRMSRLGWFDKLRDNLQVDGEIGWFVVVCGDEDRAAPEEDMEEDTETVIGDDGLGSEDDEILNTPRREGYSSASMSRSAGLRAMFGRKKLA